MHTKYSTHAHGVDVCGLTFLHASASAPTLPLTKYFPAGHTVHALASAAEQLPDEHCQYIAIMQYKQCTETVHITEALGLA